MRRVQAWKLLIWCFAVFWVVFAVFLIAAQLPFYIISLALSTTLVLSFLIVILAWAYQNNM